MRKSLRSPVLALLAALAGFLAVVWIIQSRHTAAATTSLQAEPLSAAASRPPLVLLGGKITVFDVEGASRKFLDSYHSIHLTPEQEAIKKAALEPMPAPCCANSSAYMCCCPCNLSKSVWGLSNYAIAEEHVTAGQLQTVVDAWLGFLNPDGFRGTACYQGRCEEKPSKDGCGGMEEANLHV